MEIKIQSLESIHEAAREFIAAMGDNTVFALYGKMGAGKTTFVKALCEELGVTDVITSPTFAIVNEYHGAAGACSLYHFDMYRILCPEELESTGFYDYPLEENVFAIEWAEHIADVLPPHTIRITINQLAEETREIIIEGDERFC